MANSKTNDGALSSKSANLIEANTLNVENPPLSRESETIEPLEDSTSSLYGDMAPFQRYIETYSKSESSVAGMAEKVGRVIFNVTKSAADRVNDTAELYSNRKGVTSSPVVVRQRTKDGIESFAEGSAFVGHLTKNSLGFLARQAEKGGETAAGRFKIDRGSNPRFAEAVQAFQILGDAFEASGDHLFKTVTSSAESVIYSKYGDQVAATSSRALSAGSQVVKVGFSARGVPGLLIKSVGRGVVRAHLKDGRDVVLQEGERTNEVLERTPEQDSIVLDGDDEWTRKTETRAEPQMDDLIMLDDDDTKGKQRESLGR